MTQKLKFNFCQRKIVLFISVIDNWAFLKKKKKYILMHHLNHKFISTRNDVKLILLTSYSSIVWLSTNQFHIIFFTWWLYIFYNCLIIPNTTIFTPGHNWGPQMDRLWRPCWRSLDWEYEHRVGSVSYTHLTLPTILLV